MEKKITIEVCLNSNQPANLDVTEYNVYVYDENNQEIEALWQPDQLVFQVHAYVEVLKQDYTIANIKWKDLEGNETR